MNEHTPGPWRYELQPEPHGINEYRKTMQDCFVLYATRGVSDWVADVFVKVQRREDLEYLRASLSYDEKELLLATEGEGEANARLITAAPDLLAACEAAINTCATSPNPSGGAWVQADVVDLIHAAIDKAKKGTP